jgi:hypothetical protein
MLKIFKTLLLTISILLVCEVIMSKNTVNKRFDKSLAIFKSYYQKNKNPDLQSLYDFMSSGNRRIGAFNFQALSKIYQNYPQKDAKDFFKKTIRFEFKAIEDGIGAVDKWNEIIKTLNDNNSTMEKRETAKRNFKEAQDFLILVLTGKKSPLLLESSDEDLKRLTQNFEKDKEKSLYNKLNWLDSPNLLQQLETDIYNYPFLDYNEDRPFVIKHLIKNLEKINSTDFDFDYLENTKSKKGLHEFRRELHWFSIKLSNLNGVIVFSDSQSGQAAKCPNPDLMYLLDDEKLKSSPYTKLPPIGFKGQESCFISKCLFYNLSKTIDEVGTLKDEVEKLNYIKDLDNKTPKKYGKAMKSIYMDFKNSKTLELLIKEMKSCNN